MMITMTMMACGLIQLVFLSRCEIGAYSEVIEFYTNARKSIYTLVHDDASMSKAHATLHPQSDQMPTRLRLTHLSELSAHDQGLTLVLDTAILLHAAQVHAATRNDPSTSKKACQHALDQNILFRRVDRQLSWSHRQAIGWKQMKVPRKAPISATRSWKLVTALAMM